MHSRVQAQGKLIESTKANCDERIRVMAIHEEMMQIGYMSKNDELRQLKGELDQTRAHMFSIHSQMSFYHDTLIRSVPSAAEAKAKFTAEAKTKFTAEKKRKEIFTPSP